VARSSRTRRGGIAAALVALAAVVITLIATSGGSGRGAATPATSSRRADTPAGAAARPAPAASRAGTDGVVAVEERPSPGGVETHAPLEDPLTAYKRVNQYPPTSRPLGREHDILTPNRRYENVRPSKLDNDLTYRLTADKNTVVGDDVLNVILEVWRDGEPFPVTIHEATADLDDDRRGTYAPIPFALPGAAGRYETAFAMAQTPYRHTARVRMNVRFEHAPGQFEDTWFVFLYTPDEAIPARFTGTFREAIEDGSLVIYAGIEVDQPGWYLIDCNLFGPGDQPIAWSRHKGDLTQADREVRLLYFGKVLTDTGVAGPYHLGQLRGARYVEGREPDLETMPFFEGTYTTKPYRLDQFSDAEWTSDHKDEMIQMLEEQQGGPHDPSRVGNGGGTDDDTDGQ
jgi:hypothetical protein